MAEEKKEPVKVQISGTSHGASKDAPKAPKKD